MSVLLSNAMVDAQTSVRDSRTNGEFVHVGLFSDQYGMGGSEYAIEPRMRIVKSEMAEARICSAISRRPGLLKRDALGAYANKCWVRREGRITGWSAGR